MESKTLKEIYEILMNLNRWRIPVNEAHELIIQLAESENQKLREENGQLTDALNQWKRRVERYDSVGVVSKDDYDKLREENERLKDFCNRTDDSVSFIMDDLNKSKEDVKRLTMRLRSEEADNQIFRSKIKDLEDKVREKEEEFETSNECNCTYMTFGEHSHYCPKFKQQRL